MRLYITTRHYIKLFLVINLNFRHPTLAVSVTNHLVKVWFKRSGFYY